MSFRSWATIITLVLLALVVFFGRHQIIQAFGLLDSVNLWILAIMIPLQFFSYYTVGGMIFSYLRSKGNLKDTTHWQMTRMALELNFVNHILPSGGVAGFSYLGWLLHHHGVSSGRATMAQIVRFVLSFVSFLGLLVIAILVLAFDHKINKTILIISGLLVVLAVSGIALLVYLINTHERLIVFSGWLTRKINKIVSRFTRGKKTNLVKLQVIETFFTEVHQDYLEIRREKKLLKRPFIWSILFNLADVSLVLVAFLALGFWVNPATLFIAFGISSIAGLLSATPGGAGVYEAVMIAFLVSAGVPAEVAIAGTLLARVALILGAIIFGYIFYQLTIAKYGKRPNSANI